MRKLNTSFAVKKKKKTVDWTAYISVSWNFRAKEKPHWISFKILLILI